MSGQVGRNGPGNRRRGVSGDDANGRTAAGTAFVDRLRSLPLLEGLLDIEDLERDEILVVVIGVAAVLAGCIALGLSGLAFNPDLDLQFGSTIWVIPLGMCWAGATCAPSASVPSDAGLIRRLGKGS